MAQNEVGIRICKECNKSLSQTMVTYGSIVFIEWELCHWCSSAPAVKPPEISIYKAGKISPLPSTTLNPNNGHGAGDGFPGSDY